MEVIEPCVPDGRVPLRVTIPEGELSIRFLDNHDVDPMLPGKLVHQALCEFTSIMVDLQYFQGACLLPVPFLNSYLYVVHANDPVTCLVRVSGPLFTHRTPWIVAEVCNRVVPHAAFAASLLAKTDLRALISVLNLVALKSISLPLGGPELRL